MKQIVKSQIEFLIRARILTEIAYNQGVRILASANQVTMKRIITLLAVMSVLASLPSCICAARVDNNPVKSLDLTRYLGTWYEIARFDHSFERGMENVVAEYLLRDDGKIDVINSGWKDGKANFSGFCPVPRLSRIRRLSRLSLRPAAGDMTHQNLYGLIKKERSKRLRSCGILLLLQGRPSVEHSQTFRQ